MTYGHLDIITRAAHLFDEVVVAVMHNVAKPGVFDVATRVRLIEQSLPPVVGGVVRVEAFGGRLLVDVCRDLDVGAIVKGVRDTADYAYERPMARMNTHLSGVETVFLAADPQWEHVSSSLIRDVAAHGGDVGDMVPAPVRTALLAL